MGRTHAFDHQAKENYKLPSSNYLATSLLIQQLHSVEVFWKCKAVLVQAASMLEKAQALILDLDLNPDLVTERLCDPRKFLISQMGIEILTY